MLQPSKKSKPSPLLRALVPALLCIPLSACFGNGTAIKPVTSGVPYILLEETPAPSVPNENTMTDTELAVFIQNQDKALKACNADKSDIAKLVKPE